MYTNCLEILLTYTFHLSRSGIGTESLHFYLASKWHRCFWSRTLLGLLRSVCAYAFFAHAFAHIVTGFPLFFHLNTLFRSQYIITSQGILWSPQVSQTPSHPCVKFQGTMCLYFLAISIVEFHVFSGHFLIKNLSPPLGCRLHARGSVCLWLPLNPQSSTPCRVLRIDTH